MKISKDTCYAYTHLLWPCQPRNDQNHIVFSKRFQVTCTVSLLLLFTSAYIFWPSDPYLKIVRLKLKRIKVHRVPHITVDISMLLTLSVQNADVYSMDFGAVDVAVSYRGKPLGHVRSENGHVRAMGSSFVDADAEFAGIGVLPEIVFLLEDLAKGTVPFDTVSQVRGQMGILFFHFPIKAKLSCEVLVSTINQTIVRQHCLHELCGIVIQFV
uniref:Late embryogenesis abundant protein n=1 Tax=Cicer arietinum TaxID=3827 RepID=A0A076L4S1_CICAR|nr:late embryogenesis abundant protein [Cicer arietinum]